MINWKDILGDWVLPLQEVFKDTKVIENLTTVNNFYKSGKVYPDQSNVFKAFKECPYAKLSVIILGQDPYHTENQATGLAFANPKDARMSPSLKIIQDTLARTVYKDEEFIFDQTLVSWANQGVLLLNTALTVEADKPLSHEHLWTQFTGKLLLRLNQFNSGLIYCLWGKHAQGFDVLINSLSNTILESTHPCSAHYRGEPWDCNHFVKINEQLKAYNNITIKW
jgi:uracil-DNA glycosylase